MKNELLKESTLKKDIVYRHIKQLIVSCYFPMGSKLSETIIEKKLHANKAPIRDALKRLQAEGLVERRPKSGTYVFSLSNQDLIDLLNFRFVIESQATILSFDKHPQKLISELDAVLDMMKRDLKTNNIRDYLDQDSNFHQTLVSQCDNKYFIESYKLVSAVMDTARNFLGNNVAHLHRSVIQHEDILNAIKSLDIGKVVELLREHILPDYGAYWKGSNLNGIITKK